MSLSTTGKHLIAEYWGCPPECLNSVDAVKDMMQRAALLVGATIVQSVFHRFSPQGVSGVVVIQESHLSVHTWPEAGYAAVDFYTCGTLDPVQAHMVLMEGFQASREELRILSRGEGAIASKKVPTLHYFLTSGTGESQTPLNAFDSALLSSGVGDTNLIKLSSILPPSTPRTRKHPLPAGARVPIAYASMESSTPGEHISAAVAVAVPKDVHTAGLIMECHERAPLADTLEKVRLMALVGMEHRGTEYKEILVEGAEHRVVKHGCAFAAVVLWGSKAWENG